MLRFHTLQPLVLNVELLDRPLERDALSPVLLMQSTGFFEVLTEPGGRKTGLGVRVEPLSAFAKA